MQVPRTRIDICLPTRNSLLARSLGLSKDIIHQEWLTLSGGEAQRALLAIVLALGIKATSFLATDKRDANRCSRVVAHSHMPGQSCKIGHSSKLFSNRLYPSVISRVFSSSGDSTGRAHLRTGPKDDGSGTNEQCV